MQYFEIEPVDTLVFRKSEPNGCEAEWPLPSVIHEGLRANLLKLTKEPRDPVPVKVQRRAGPIRKIVQSFNYQSLRTIGPFPRRDAQLFVPRPCDMVPVEKHSDGNLEVIARQPRKTNASGNWPGPWLRGWENGLPASGVELPEWISLTRFQSHLSGGQRQTLPAEEYALPLYDSESRIEVNLGVSGRSVQQPHVTNHLRLRPGVSLWISALLGDREIAGKAPEVGPKDLIGSPVFLGAEGRVVRLHASTNTNPFSAIPPPVGRLIKWVLISPAVFAGGWRPGWVDESDGTVKLPAQPCPRNPGETRNQWRERLNQANAPLSARMVAACTGKPIIFSGRDIMQRQSKPTRMAVPAGAVYAFEADDDLSADLLVKALHGRVRSDFYGEKGFGLGYCGSWSDAP